MARCLRCRAGNEWIEGNVKDIDVDSLQKEIDALWKALEMADKLIDFRVPPARQGPHSEERRRIKAYIKARKKLGGWDD